MFALIWIALLASAQTQPAARGVTVSGTVQDQTKAILPNAQVVLLLSGTESPAQSGMTDGAGAFHFDRVAPGDYDVRAEFPGFKAVAVKVRVGARAPAPVTIVLPLEGLTQEIAVSGSGGGVTADARSNLNAISVDADTLDDLPLLDQDVVGSLSRFLDASAISTNGATLLVDGVEVNALGLSASAIQQVKINQDPYAAEFMRPGRGRIEIVTKPGGKQYNGTFNLRFRDSSFYARNAFAASKAPEQRRIAEGTFGGPLRFVQRTSFLLSGTIDSEANQSIVFADTASGLFQRNVATPYQRVLLAGTLNHQQGDRNTQSIRFTHLDERNTNQGVGGTTLPEAGSNHEDREDEATFSNQTVFSPRLLNEIRVLGGVEREPRTSLTAAPRVVVLDAFTGGGAQNDSLRTEQHFTLVEALTYSPSRHVMKVGLNIPDWSWRGYDDRTNTAGTFYFSSLSDYQNARPYSFVQQAGNGQVTYLERVIGVFAQDEMRLLPNLSLAAGIRYDWQSYIHDPNNVAPRVSMAYAPGGSSKLVIRGGTGLFYDRIGPNPVLDALRFDGVRLLRYVIPDPGYPVALTAGQTLAAQAPSVVRFAPEAVVPSMLQSSVGIERELRPRTTLGVTAISTRGYDLFRSRDLNAPAPPLFASRPDATRGVVREIESTGTRHALVLETTFRTQVRHISGTVQYSEVRNSDDTGGVNWMPPNSYDLSREYASSDGERRHQLETYASANTGRWGNVGLSFEAGSGRPYSLTTGRDDFNTGTANARPAGVPRNSLRGPAFVNFDLRWSHDMTFVEASGRKVTLTAGVDAFNVINKVNYSYYVGNESSPFFGRPISSQAPRRLQFSLRARY
jgi:carboxypeptidase family protein/TonB-dependent receptor-like protein